MFPIMSMVRKTKKKTVMEKGITSRVLNKGTNFISLVYIFDIYTHARTHARTHTHTHTHFQSLSHTHTLTHTAHTHTNTHTHTHTHTRVTSSAHFVSLDKKDRTELILSC
jgi:hypothetical protein